MFGLLAYVAGLINDLAASLWGAVVPSADASADAAEVQAGGGAAIHGHEQSEASAWTAANDNVTPADLTPASPASIELADAASGEPVASVYGLTSFEDDVFETVELAGPANIEADAPSNFDNALFEAFGALQRANALFAVSNDDVQLLSAHEYYDRAFNASSSDLPFS